jgi:hypothetical protein
MLEFLLCSSLTILPDFLFRRFVQGKRIGQEITLFSMWYELRWGITACVLLTLTLITLIFYFHPATNNAISYFRTVPVLPETIGRVAEVYVGIREEVEQGTPLFRLDSAEQQAAVESARRRITEVDAALDVARIGLQVAEGVLRRPRARMIRLSMSTKPGPRCSSATRTEAMGRPCFCASQPGRRSRLEAKASFAGRFERPTSQSDRRSCR